MNKCTHDLIHNNPLNYTCEYVKQNCEYEYIPFYNLHYCTFESNLLITIPFLITTLTILFYLLAHTTNTYLSPPLTKLSDRMKMSQNLAGVTFLAFGNGAADVFTSLVACSGHNGLKFSISSLLGSSVIITLIVFSIVVLISKEVKVNGKLFIRDIILYLIAICLLFLFSWKGRIGVLESIGFLSLYIM